jgi:hypothetical protein
MNFLLAPRTIPSQSAGITLPGLLASRSRSASISSLLRAAASPLGEELTQRADVLEGPREFKGRGNQRGPTRLVEPAKSI